MLAYQYNEDSKEFLNEVNCQKDPLESEIAGKDIWLLPANSTCEKPLEPKEGFKVKFLDGAWQYEAIPEPEPEPTEKEKTEREIWNLKGELSSTDYKAIKCAEGWISEEEYAPIKAERQALRDKINELEEKLKTRYIKANNLG